MTDSEKVGRNDDCPCGSKKKYKFCCGDVKKVLKRGLTPIGFQRCFLKLVKDAGGSVDISYNDIMDLPENEALAIKYDVETDSFRFKVVKVKVKKSVIIQPNKKLVLN